LRPEAESGGDVRALAEAKQVASGKPQEELAEEAAAREHERGQRFKDHFERIAIVTLYAVSLGMLVATGIWFLHVITPVEPTAWRWLNANQVQALQNGITGVILVGVLADHFKKRLG
jgi:hypothetical protein